MHCKNYLDNGRNYCLFFGLLSNVQRNKKRNCTSLHVVWPSDDCNDAHNEELTVQSFYIMKDNQVVSYGAVLRMETTIDNEKYQIGGLSCIATLPNYRRQGLSSKIVQTATKWIEDNLDFGIFT